MRSLSSVLLVAAVLVTTLAASPASPAQASGMVSLPLVVCITSHGVEESPKSFPAARTVAVPAADQSLLSIYTDDVGELYLVAPRGWACQAGVGADGNASIAAYPPGEEPFPIRTWPKTAQAVTADLYPVCGGCITIQACPYFPAAKQDLLEFGPNAKCPSPPVGELTDRLSSTVVAYEDPPGVKGLQSPSGGSYAANGVVTFKQGTTHTVYGSWMENCVLPAKLHDLCTAALNNFAYEWDAAVRAS